MFKSIDKAKLLTLVDEVNYQDHQVTSRNIVASKETNITLFAFDKDEELSAHTTPGDALVNVLDGTVKITIGDEDFLVSKGQSIIMPANISHALYAVEKFKMLLIISL